MHLCEDLTAKIIRRLPAKSLLRSRSVSKSWCSHISNPDFIRLNVLQSAKNPQKVLLRQQVLVKEKMYYREEYIEYFYTLHPDQSTGIKPVNLPRSNFDIIGSCNGILYLIEFGTNISLWNPSIRRKRTLPANPFEEPRVAIGFGFDPISNDYKIGGISYSCNEKQKNNMFTL